MIEPKIVKSRIKIWRLGKDGYESNVATLLEGPGGADVVYDWEFKPKYGKVECDVCLAQEQGFSCPRLVDFPGAYEYEGGCMDCESKCRQNPVHIGVRNYCIEHVHIQNARMGAVRAVDTK